ncbi:hypothetical protein Q3A66_14045 [Hymenobacter sp. BT770]|uniref:hypothetical protein n=1 Tax=Hymenobacter sp. BT770 TaxID=2886942 RepID=UPI001D10FDDA|nr:hypothetical protein [Hymenobacter sp. BT770]MCC3154043.1 hypothetical protein [Hymenobacter sp. BT770]MDO3416187.1 hypothetical protein [Hymenobacter sp. BT770]
MNKPLKYLLLGLIGAAIAGWLKMLLPEFPSSLFLGEGASARNKLGIVLAMPLYELYYYWWGYLLTLIVLAFAKPFIARHPKRGWATALLGLFTGAFIYSGYKLYTYQKASEIYARHAAAGVSKPLFHWAELPLDAEMLLVYCVTGLMVGWIYFRWFMRA